MNFSINQKGVCKKMKTKPNIQIAEYGGRRIITDPEFYRIAAEMERDPNVLSGRDGVYALYKMMGMDIEYDEIFAL